MSLRSTSVAALALLSLSAACAHSQPAPGVVRSAPVKPQRTALITGRVVDENGAPVAGLGVSAVISDADFNRLISDADFNRLTANLWTPHTVDGVTAYSYNGLPPEDLIARDLIRPTVTTAPDGTYTFLALTTARYYLMDGGNLNAGKVLSPTLIDAHEGQTVRAPDIVVSPAVTIRGQLVSKDGAPLPGVVLRYFDAVHPPEVAWFMDSYHNRRSKLTTDKNGNFTLETAPGAARFFVTGSGTFFGFKDLLLTPQQSEHWPERKDVYGQDVWGVKSGVGVYAADRGVEVKQDGQPAQELAHGQWVQVPVKGPEDVSLVLRFEKLTFKNGKTPAVPASSFLHEGDPRK